MAIRCVSYNIQYGVGMDGRYDLDRIVEAIGGADVIALQEVTRGAPWNGGADMVAGLGAAFPGRFAATHFPADVDFGSMVVDGRAQERRFQFGNMVISRWPLTATRGHLLPRSMRTGRLNLQRGALEAMVATPQGPIRFHSVHLDHVDIEERLAQIDALRAIALDFERDGGAITGLAEYGFPELPLPRDFLLMGDFNFAPGSREHAAMLAGGAIVEASAGAPGDSWADPRGVEPGKRLDHCFANPALAARIGDCRIDEAAMGSDHKPVWLTIG